jgi:hypothetical protein
VASNIVIPSVGYTIRHRLDPGVGFLQTSEGKYQARNEFFVCEGDHTNWHVFRVILQLTDEAYSSALPQFHSDHGEATFREVILRWTVDRIERGLHENEFSQGLNFIDLGVDDFEVLRRMVREKNCDYQVAEARDLFCSASSHLDSAKIAQIGLRFFATTSAHLCLECSLPDKKDICSHLSHAKVKYDGLGGRRAEGAECGLRKPGIKTPVLCVAGGNDCWVRIVQARGEDRAPIYAAPMLTQALDLLDSSWRLRFETKSRLLRLRSAESTAILETECSNSEEFQVRLSALADVFKSLQIDSKLVKDEKIAHDQTFKRMRVALAEAITDEPSFELASGAIHKLEALNELRVTSQHSNTNANAARAQIDLGIRYYPEASWKGVWDDLRSRLVRALATISTELQRSSDPE